MQLYSTVQCVLYIYFWQHDIHPAIHVVPHVLTLILSQGTAGAQEQVCKACTVYWC